MIYSSERDVYDYQWGLHINHFDKTIQWKNPYKIAIRIAESIAITRKYVNSLHGSTLHAASSELIRIYSMDCLGRDSLLASTYSNKTNEDFKKVFTIPIFYKLFVLLLIIIINLFFVWFCISKGRSKGLDWQKSWLFAAAFKIVLDVIISRIFQIVVIRFYIPEFILREVVKIKSGLIYSAKCIINKDFKYSFDKFSASDYLHASTLIAKANPELIESKLILCRRNPLPMMLGIGLPNYSYSINRNNFSNMTFIQILTTVMVTSLLYFASLPVGIQKVVLLSVPPAVFSIAGILCYQLFYASKTNFFIIMSFLVILLFCLIYLVVRTLKISKTHYRATNVKKNEILPTSHQLI